MAAKGSWNSPIYVSDDEEEHSVASQLIYNYSAPPQNTSFQGYPQMDTGSEPRSNPQKRKRDEAFNNSNNNNNYQNRNNFMGGSTAYTETKKARKRRRRMEREEALMAQSRAAQAMMPSFGVIPFLPALNLNNSWPGPAPPFNHPFSLGMPLPLPPQNHNNNHQNNHFYPPLPPAEHPTYNNPPLRYDGLGNGNGHGNGYSGSGHQDHRHPPESSSWVSSMAANQSHHQQNPDLDFSGVRCRCILPLTHRVGRRWWSLQRRRWRGGRGGVQSWGLG
ncbi:hypothetical protein C8F04DRAFT_659416 [Mycena alexandri]|uniref:Uncharacterized protein n=1 Tax=Mycena alexandri TaxID=1745969 RepID=A0AAD6SU02_9AGAR|nr:hypothetical protein C8F04DRAFT_659416 [Mycena alexandri]